MTVLDHLSPSWSETRVASGRGNVGTGLFDRVFFVDVFDGLQGQARVRNLALAAGASRLSQVISSGHEVALEDDRSPTLLLPQSGQIFCAVGARDLVARPGQAMVLPRGRRRTVTMRDGDRIFSRLRSAAARARRRTGVDQRSRSGPRRSARSFCGGAPDR